MESQDTDSVTAFDTLYTTNHLQMLKILLPHLQAEMQPHIAVYIKLKELLFTLHFSKENRKSYCSLTEKETDIQSLIRELSPYMNGNEKDMLKKLSELKENMEKLLEEKMNRWMYLEELAAKIESGEMAP